MLPSTWEGDFQNLCNFDFDQARVASFPSQLFSGNYKFVQCRITFSLALVS